MRSYLLASSKGKDTKKYDINVEMCPVSSKTHCDWSGGKSQDHTEMGKQKVVDWQTNLYRLRQVCIGEKEKAEISALSASGRKCEVLLDQGMGILMF